MEKRQHPRGSRQPFRVETRRGREREPTARVAFGGGHRLGTALHLRQDRHLKTERYPDGSQDPSESYRAWTWSLSAEDRWRIDERNSLIGSLALEGLDVIHAESLRSINGDPATVDDARPSETLLSPQIEFRRVLGPDHRFTSSSEGFEEIPYVPDDQVELLGIVHLGKRVDLRGVWFATGRRVAYGRDGKIDLNGYSVFDLGLAVRVGVAELTLDEFNRSIMLYWERKGEADLYLYEMIQVSDDGRSRSSVVSGLLLSWSSWFQRCC